MNKTPSETTALISKVKPLVYEIMMLTLFSVPAIDIIPAIEAAKGNIEIGAENMYFERAVHTQEKSPRICL